MKKLTFIFLSLISLSLNGCNSTAGKNNEATENTEGQVVKLTAESFQKLVWDYKKNPQEWVFLGDQTVIIDFYADWCGPCKQMAPAVYEAGETFKDFLTIEKLNIDIDIEITEKYKVRAVPTLIILDKNGKEVARKIGAMPKYKLYEWIESTVLGYRNGNET